MNQSGPIPLSGTKLVQWARAAAQLPPHADGKGAWQSSASQRVSMPSSRIPAARWVELFGAFIRPKHLSLSSVLSTYNVHTHKHTGLPIIMHAVLGADTQYPVEGSALHSLLEISLEANAARIIWAAHLLMLLILPSAVCNVGGIWLFWTAPPAPFHATCADHESENRRGGEWMILLSDCLLVLRARVSLCAFFRVYLKRWRRWRGYLSNRGGVSLACQMNHALRLIFIRFISVCWMRWNEINVQQGRQQFMKVSLHFYIVHKHVLV